MVSLFVIFALVLKLTNYHINFHLVILPLHWSLFFLMSEALRLTRLAVRNIMCHSLMIIVNLVGSICCVINLMSSKFSWNFSPLLNEGSIRRLSPCSLIAVGKMSI
jgi:hypothetical protein